MIEMSISDEHEQEKTSVKRPEASDLDKDWQIIDEGTESRQKKTEKGNSGNKVIDQIDIALVAYRDHGDARVKPNSQGLKRTFGKVFFTSKSSPEAIEGDQFEIFPFSTSEHEFEAFCTKVRAQGGDDQPEDVFGGLEKAVNLSWSKDSETKMIFHICDAPCHGTEFHVGHMGDNYPQGDPKGRTHTALFGRLNEMEIQYYFGKINSSTNIMVEKFAEAYDGQVYQFNVGQVNEIRESVVQAVHQAAYVQRSRVATRMNKA